MLLAQVWRNRTRQHPLLMVRLLCTVLPFTEHTAKDVGRLLARSRTSDPKDLAKLASAAEYPVRLLTV